jgi:HlyD family secretion protein
LPGAAQSLVQAQANAEQAQKQQGRMRDLQARGFVGQAQLDDANRNFDVAASQVNSARLQVRTNAPAGSDSALALAALAQARANLQLARVKLEQNAILAPVDGTLIARSVERGDIVQSGKALMVLAPTGETQIVVQVDERNFAKLALGQKALASADAFADQRFEAVVAYINPGINATRGAVEVKLRVASPPAYLRQDMTVSVDIETARRDGARVIPTGAVRDASSAAPWVMVVRDGHTVRQPVRLGLLGDSRSEVLSGIDAGEVVILATLGQIAVGQHVRPQAVPVVPATAATMAPSAPRADAPKSP